jgi:hypothetical protein
VNAVGGVEARVLYLGAPWGAFLEGVPVYANWYNPALAERVAEATTEEMAARVVAEERATHVIIDRDPDLPVFRSWLATHARKLLSSRESDLYEVRPPVASGTGPEISPPPTAAAAPPSR